MARRARAEVEGGLYQLITRGKNCRPIFNAPAVYEKFLSLLAIQKSRLPFFLYAYCLMTPKTFVAGKLSITPTDSAPTLTQPSRFAHHRPLDLKADSRPEMPARCRRRF